MTALSFSLISFSTTSCRYRFGSGSAELEGHYFVTSIENQTDYRLLDSQLQTEIVNVMRRHKNVVLTHRDQARTIIGGKISHVDKLDREKNAQGETIEIQFVIQLRLEVTTDGEVQTYEVKNIQFANSSGIYRVDRGESEDIALRAAIRDLAEAAILALSQQW